MPKAQGMRLRTAVGVMVVVLIGVSAGAHLALAAGPAGQIFTVTTAADVDGSSCGPTCSLRQAIRAATNQDGPAQDIIVFAIPSGQTKDIAPGALGALPVISEPLTIDGTTQPGIRLVGSSLSTADANGLHVLLGGSGSVIRGLEVRGFPGSGILLDGVHDLSIGGESAADGNVLVGNGNDGVTVIGDATAINNRILGNRIFDNAGGGIDLGDHLAPGGQPSVGCPAGGVFPGPNSTQCAPFLTVAQGPVSSVTVAATARTGVGSARVEVFWSPTCWFVASAGGRGYARAETLLGSSDVPLSGAYVATGSTVFGLPSPLTGGFLTATTTTPDGTSEFAGCTPIPTPTDEQISVTAAPLLAEVGQQITVKLNVRNNGPYRDEDVIAGLDLSGVPITSVASSQGSCPPEFAPSAYCLLGGLDPGTSATITVIAVPAAVGQFSADAQVFDLTGADPAPANNLVTRPITIGGSTPSGTNVLVASGGPVDLTFGSVTAAGTTSITTSTTGPAVPSGYEVGSPATFYDLQTTATYSGTITVCISYAGVTPAPTQLLHYENGTWKDVTNTPIDTANQRICGTTTSLSPFALATLPTPPTLTVPSNVATTATGPTGAVVSYSATAVDALGVSVSPVCSPAAGATFAVGMTTVTCTATDTRGRISSASFTVTVGYRFSGFFQPLNDPVSSTNPMSVFKAGSTVSVKFGLTYANGTPIADTAAGTMASACAVTISLTQMPGNAPPVDEVIASTTATAGNCFRYDAGAHQFIFNLGTKTYPAPSLYVVAAQVSGAGGAVLATHSLSIGLR